jgi:hypothetical protein
MRHAPYDKRCLTRCWRKTRETPTNTALSGLSSASWQGSSTNGFFSSAVRNWKQLRRGPIHSALATSDVLLLSNMKIQITGRFRFIAKIKFQSQAMFRQRHETDGAQMFLTVGHMVGPVCKLYGWLFWREDLPACNDTLNGCCRKYSTLVLSFPLPLQHTHQIAVLAPNIRRKYFTKYAIRFVYNTR